MMSYVMAVLVLVVFTAIYVIGYCMNSKIKIECDRNSCSGCSMQGCANRFEEEEK